MGFPQFNPRHIQGNGMVVMVQVLEITQELALLQEAVATLLTPLNEDVVHNC